MEYGLFEYASAPQIFLQRTGRGPLHMAWDTNVLIDYLKFGKALWNDEELDIEDPKYADQVYAIGNILDPYYCFWDIRVHLFDEILNDAKRKLSIERQSQREWAIDRFARALMFAEWSEEEETPEPDNGFAQDSLFHVEPVEPSEGSAHQRLTDALPNGHDRILVNEAIERGMHVFLTQDRGILKAAHLARTVDLLIVSPCGFIQLFEEAGISAVQFPMPDLARISKVIQALP
ncbi:hypothetical protein [Streptomyces parvulus]|uniref:hypothetical protein n=1 Tax=Streptomyces parvulus TaxID=146923 RepID=UPI003443E150